MKLLRCLASFLEMERAVMEVGGLIVNGRVVRWFLRVGGGSVDFEGRERLGVACM